MTVYTNDRRAEKILNGIFMTAVFFGFLYLMSMVPFGSDDWAWGSSAGEKRLSSFFEGYNGRYLGNMLIMLLTKSNALKTAGMACISFSAVYFIYRYVGSDEIFYFVSALLMMFIMPSNIYRQTMGWASGLANYIPPVSLTLLYLSEVKNIFGAEKPEYGKIFSVSAFFICFCANLFMEHVTLMNLAVTAGVLIYSRVKFKSFFQAHISASAGSAAGAGAMFSNSAYRRIISGNDGYRTVADGTDFFSGIIEKADRICRLSFESSLLMNIVITLLVSALAICVLRENKRKNKKGGRDGKILLCSVFYDVFYCIFTIIKNYAQSRGGAFDTNFMIVLRFALMTLFVMSFPAAAFSSAGGRGRAFKMTVPVLCHTVLTFPLLFVTPVTGRCFYPSYIMLIVYACETLKLLAEKYPLKPEIKKAVFAFSMAGMCAAFSFYAVKYSEISAFESERAEFVIEQIDKGSKTVYLPHYPKNLENYTEGTTPRLALWNTRWETRYKEFYRIDKSIKVTPISYKQYAEIEW